MDPLRISDPERIRALAHPVRLALLDVLRDVGEATATECAERVGESVASCSFHLRMLEKYGYIERAEQRGREKPWRVRHAGAAMDARPDPEVPGSLHAVQELAALTVAREAERVTRFLSAADTEPEEWLQAITISTGGFWATAEELRSLSEQVQHLLDRFAGRSDDPSKRPEGARHARLFAAVNPDPLPSEER
ncbi:winged helix-turn-helix domain-containing protein [Ornithinimicrobium humiphilum]|uniref:ArsR/SmtB family transcription factor n=1 Tax=Ornithinimicrobium humiphilum TaxID=125288 RepID=UPI0031DB99D0